MSADHAAPQWNKDRMPVNLEGVDLDTHIFRIYKKEYLLATIQSGYDTLVPVNRWEDPFENFFLSRGRILDSVSGQMITLGNLAEDWYGQCWSLHEETDAMWRIYSPQASAEAIKVRSTVGKLLDNLRSFKATTTMLHAFVGKVQYMTEAQIFQKMNGASFMMDGASGGQNDGFASWLCIKREAFEHEAEVRLIACDNDPKVAVKKLINYPLDANALFEEAVLDPRLNEVDLAKVDAELRAAGWQKPIRRSDLYRVPVFNLNP